MEIIEGWLVDLYLSGDLAGEYQYKLPKIGQMTPSQARGMFLACRQVYSYAYQLGRLD